MPQTLLSAKACSKLTRLINRMTLNLASLILHLHKKTIKISLKAVK